MSGLIVLAVGAACLAASGFIGWRERRGRLPAHEVEAIQARYAEERKAESDQAFAAFDAASGGMAGHYAAKDLIDKERARRYKAFRARIGHDDTTALRSVSESYLDLRQGHDQQRRRLRIFLGIVAPVVLYLAMWVGGVVSYHWTHKCVRSHIVSGDPGDSEMHTASASVVCDWTVDNGRRWDITGPLRLFRTGSLGW